MKKVNIILDETTIINFPFFWKLMKRYALLASVAPLIALGLGAHIYYGQKNIYQQMSSFKYNTEEADSPTSAIANLMGEKTGSLSASEIRGIVMNVDFQQELAARVRKHPRLQEMVFSQINSKEIIKSNTLFNGCANNEECEQNRLRGVVSGFVNISGDPNVDNKFWVQVKSLDKLTTQEVLTIVVGLISDTRRDEARHKISEQLNVTEELAKKKRIELENVDLTSLRDKKKTLQDKMLALQTKAANLSKIYQSQKIKLSYAETHLAQTKNALKSDVTEEDKSIITKKNVLLDKRNKIQKDIEAIRTLSKQLTKRDRSILSQLEGEERKLTRSIKKVSKKGRSISNTLNFIEKKDGESGIDEFEYKVLQKQLVKIKLNLDKAVSEKDLLLKEMTNVDNQLEMLRPEMGSLKLLEEKVIQLKLIESTVVSDLLFDKKFSGLRTFKRASFSKIFTFSFGIGIFLLFLVIFSRYIIDDRIYDEFELGKSFDDLTIIGNTPDFD